MAVLFFERVIPDLLLFARRENETLFLFSFARRGSRSFVRSFFRGRWDKWLQRQWISPEYKWPKQKIILRQKMRCQNMTKKTSRSSSSLAANVSPTFHKSTNIRLRERRSLSLYKRLGIIKHHFSIQRLSFCFHAWPKYT